MPSRRILIVGGGIAGLALGRALREQGVVPEIIERAASWPTRGTGLPPRERHSRSRGAWACGYRARSSRLYVPSANPDHTGRLLAEIELAKLWNRDRPAWASLAVSFIAFFSRGPLASRCGSAQP